MSYYYADEDNPDETCTLQPETGAFSYVRVVIYRHYIREIAFTVRTKALRVGDLMALYGKPEVEEYTYSFYLYWRSRGISAIVLRYGGRYSLFLPVWSVSFTSR
jgi:hypothetical protein